MADLTGLPGASRISRGLRDLSQGQTTQEALLVAISARRLSELGLAVQSSGELPSEPELELYSLLSGESDDPFFAYNALLGELDSFVSSLEAREARAVSRF